MGLELRFPQAVQVAVGVHRAVVNAAGEERSRGLAGLELVDLKAIGGLERDELDVVLLLHGVRRLADRGAHDVAVALERDHGHVLLGRGVGGVGLELFHGLAAASGRHAAVDDGCDEILAMSALVKLRHMESLPFRLDDGACATRGVPCPAQR